MSSSSERQPCPRGIPVVVSGPSGVGKTTLSRLLVERYADVGYSISVTTRPPRRGEEEGIDYQFVNEKTFRRWIKEDRFVEYAEVYGSLYGTLIQSVQQLLDSGLDVLLDIDVQGGENIRKSFPSAVLVYVLPPTFEALKDRLTERGTESGPTLEFRLGQLDQELKEMTCYDYILINEDVERTVRRIRSIIVAERCRRERAMRCLKSTGYSLLERFEGFVESGLGE